jgi:RNA polymerase sigma factor (sigma-70 family)
MTPHDVQLLDRWCDRRDRGAMDELVRRHIHFVYGAARRQLGGDDAGAQDVAQAVFLLLIQKAPRVRSDAALAVWLHRTTRYACANARRMRERRARHELRAARTDQADDARRCDDADLLPVLDDAVAQLAPRDRAGVMLCYFQQRSYREIASVLGLTEPAARKRVSRAVGRMREFLAARGVVTTSGAVAACLARESAAATAPASLAGTASNFAGLAQLVAGASSATAAPAQIVKGVLTTMFLTKLKLAAAACAAVVVGGAVTVAAIDQIGAPLPGPALVASTTLAMGPFDVRATDKLEAQFLGVNKWGAGGKGWWAIDGSKIDDPRGPFARHQSRIDDTVTHQVIVRVTGPANGGYAVRVPGCRMHGVWDLTPSDEDAYLMGPFVAGRDKKSVDVELLLADGEWQTLATREIEPGEPPDAATTELGAVAFTHVSEARAGRATVYVAHDFKYDDGQFEVFAGDPQGNDHRCINVDGGRVGSFNAIHYVYDIPPEQVTALSVKVRPFNKKVTAKNVTLDPSTPTTPQIVVEELPEKK